MDTPESPPESISPRALERLADEMGYLHAEHQTLHTLFRVALVAAILLSLGVNLFVAKQMRMVRNQLPEQRRAVSLLVQEYQRNTEPNVRRFAAQLQEFAGRHPDFQNLLEKYRPVLGPYLGPAGATNRPMPAPAISPAANPP